MLNNETQLPVVLSIAGSDPSGGAGIQADLKTFQSLGVYGVTAITCVTSQVPGNVVDIEPVSTNSLRSQLDILFNEYHISGIKTGLLYSSELIEVVLSSLEKNNIKAPLIVDPVMVSTSGTRLLNNNALTLYLKDVIPRSTLLTPNLPEAATLLEMDLDSIKSPADCANILYQKFEIPVLLKGGHFISAEANDYLVDKSGAHTFSKPFSKRMPAHGTGCTLSASITAFIGSGLALHDSISKSKDYITASINQSFQLSSGHFTLNHNVNINHSEK